jgi:hypothetical protein
MKTVFRSTGCVCVLILSMTGVSFAGGPVKFGVKGGMAISNISPNEISIVSTFPPSVFEFESKRGPAAGVFVTWAADDVFGLQGELLYVSKGFSFGESEATDNSGNPIGKFEALTDVEVLEIPLLVHASWPTQGALRPGLVAGPALSYKLRERFKTTGAVEGSETSSLFADTGFGLAAGAELRIRSGSGWSVLEARYTLGMNDLDKDSGGLNVAKDRTWMFMAGFEF